MHITTLGINDTGKALVVFNVGRSGAGIYKPPFELVE